MEQKARIAVKVQARAKTTRLAGRLGDAYKMQLAAPPVDGKANEECVRFIAGLLNVPKSRVRVVIGLTNRMKVIEIDGANQAHVESVLSNA